MEFKWTNDIHSTTYEDGLEIRKKVFIHEQEVPLHLEVDDLEEQASHVVGYEGALPIAVARIYEKSPHIFKVQRVAVIKEKRKTGVGNQLLKEIERYAKEQGGEKLILGAQDHAIYFYQKNGYTVEGEGFLDAGIPHHSMYKIIE